MSVGYLRTNERIGSWTRKPREWEVWRDYKGWRAYHPALDGTGILGYSYTTRENAWLAIDWYELRYWAKLEEWRTHGVRYYCAVCRAPSFKNNHGGIYHVTTGTTRCE